MKLVSQFLLSLSNCTNLENLEFPDEKAEINSIESFANADPKTFKPHRRMRFHPRFIQNNYKHAKNLILTLGSDISEAVLAI